MPTFRQPTQLSSPGPSSSSLCKANTTESRVEYQKLAEELIIAAQKRKQDLVKQVRGAAMSARKNGTAVSRRCPVQGRNSRRDLIDSLLAFRYNSMRGKHRLAMQVRDTVQAVAKRLAEKGEEPIVTDLRKVYCYFFTKYRERIIGLSGEADDIIADFNIAGKLLKALECLL